MSKTNHVRLVGHLGQKPNVMSTDNGVSVSTVSLATHDIYKDKQGQKVENTTWHNIVAFGSIADLLGKYLKKGAHVMVLGRLVTKQYTDRNGVDKYVTEVICEDILFLDKKP